MGGGGNQVHDLKVATALHLLCSMSTTNMDEKHAQLDKSAAIDWNAHKHQSLQPGGFADQRSRLWYKYVFPMRHPWLL